jgi:hypothetical protein
MKESIEIILIIVTIVLLWWSAFGAWEYYSNYTCVSYEKTSYYDNTGTALAVFTGNYGFLGMNGYREITTCSEWVLNQEDVK